MTSDSGLASQDTDYAREIQEALDELHQMQQAPRLVTSPEELEALERHIRQGTDRLGSLLVGYHLQQALDSPALQAEQELLVSHRPTPLKSDGKVQVRIRTAQGHTVAVWTTYYRRKGQRRAGKRYRGVYAGLILLGIYDRCTPALAAEVSLLAAMLGSLQEAHDVLVNRGVVLDPKTVRTIAYHYAARARLVQQIDNTTLEDTVTGRRVVMSSDGGRLRLREHKRGPKTKKGRKRYTGAWREPKVLSVSVVDAEGKRDARFAPVMDATLRDRMWCSPCSAPTCTDSGLHKRIRCSLSPMEPRGSGNGSPFWCTRWGSRHSRCMSFWTFIMLCNTWGRWRRYAKTGVRKRAPTGVPTSAACCCKAKWSRSLALYVTSAEAVTARRYAHSLTTLLRTRDAWHTPSSWP
jgi:hypothetical protein